MDAKDKIEFLFKEKEIARKEILLLNRTIYSIFLLALPLVYSLMIALVTNKVSDETTSSILHLTKNKALFCLNQLIFLLWMFHFSLVVNVAALAGYVAALEEKINIAVGEKITAWESVVVEKYLSKLTSPMAISIGFWLLLFILSFLGLAYYIYDHTHNKTSAIIHSIEGAIWVYIGLRTRVARNKAYKLMQAPS